MSFSDIDIELVVVFFAGLLLGTLIHSVYCKIFRDEDKPKKIKMKRAVAGDRPTGEPWTEGESESEEEEDGFIKNEGCDKIEDDEMYKNYPINDVKQVLVVNNGLKMGKGKIGA